VLFYHDGLLKVVLFRGKSGVIYIKKNAEDIEVI